MSPLGKGGAFLLRHTKQSSSSNPRTRHGGRGWPSLPREIRADGSWAGYWAEAEPVASAAAEGAAGVGGCAERRKYHRCDIGRRQPRMMGTLVSRPVHRVPLAVPVTCYCDGFPRPPEPRSQEGQYDRFGAQCSLSEPQFRGPPLHLVGRGARKSSTPPRM